MKKLLFSLAALLMLVFSQATPAAAQAAPTTGEEAKNLVENVQKNKAAIDSFLNKALTRRAEAERLGKAELVQFFDKTIKLARELRGFGERVERAGAEMSAAKLAGFKAEAARFDKKFEDLAARPPAAIGAGFWECRERCWGFFPKWWQVVRRAMCIALCLIE